MKAKSAHRTWYIIGHGLTLPGAIEDATHRPLLLTTKEGRYASTATTYRRRYASPASTGLNHPRRTIEQIPLLTSSNQTGGMIYLSIR